MPNTRWKLNLWIDDDVLRCTYYSRDDIWRNAPSRRPAGRIYPETLPSAGTWLAAQSFGRGPVGRLAMRVHLLLWPCLCIYCCVLFTICYSIWNIGLIIEYEERSRRLVAHCVTPPLLKKFVSWRIQNWNYGNMIIGYNINSWKSRL